MRVIVDRIEENIVIVEAEDENTCKLPLALCPNVKEGDTIEINVIGKQPPKEDPHVIFERLRKKSKRNSNSQKSLKKGTSSETNTPSKESKNPD